MVDVHHFTYGAYNPVAAFLLAFLGSFLGFLCTGRARDVHSRSRRNRWLMTGAFSIGGGGIWLMHFSAILGFDVPASPVRYDLGLTLMSLVYPVVSVGIGLLVVGHGPRSAGKTAGAGLITGLGVIAMHHTGMQGIRLGGTVHYSPVLMTVSSLMAITASTVALWFAVSVRGWARVTGAAAVMGVAVCGMHYTGMAAIQVELDPDAPQAGGIRPLTMLVPIILITTAAIVVVALSALQAMTDEEFTYGAGMPKRAVHAETPPAWALKQASKSAKRPAPPARAATNGRVAAGRPSPGPRKSSRPSPPSAPVVPPAPSGG